MKKNYLFLLVVVLIVSASWVAMRARPSAKPTAASNSATSSNRAIEAGLKVHIDPATGRIVPPPANAAPNPVAKEMFKSSHEGLVEEPGTTAAGGFKVDARGRFRSAVTVSLGPDGKPLVNCLETNAVN